MHHRNQENQNEAVRTLTAGRFPMNSMRVVLDFLRTPPGVISTLLAAGLMAHLLKIAIGLPTGKLIHILEFFAAVVVGGLMIHCFLGTAIGRDTPPVNPTFFLVLFVCLIFGSGFLIIVDRKTPP
jgi:hypothetical protein